MLTECAAAGSGCGYLDAVQVMAAGGQGAPALSTPATTCPCGETASAPADSTGPANVRTELTAALGTLDQLVPDHITKARVPTTLAAHRQSLGSTRRSRLP